MAIKGRQLNVNFYAFDTGNNQPATGQASNISGYIIKDGGAPATLTNSISEPSSSNTPGIYEVVLSSTEMNADFITIGGSIPTNTGVLVYPTMVATEGNYLDTLSGFVDSLETRLTAARAGYLDNLNIGGNVASAANLSTAQSYLSIISGYTDELETRLSALRAGYLDNLNIGEDVAGTSEVADVQNFVNVISGYTDSLESGQSVISAYVDELESRLSSARAGYLDNLNIGENVASTSEVTNNYNLLITISGYTDSLESGQSTINVNLSNLPDIGTIVSSGDAAGWGATSSLTVDNIVNGVYNHTIDGVSMSGIQEVVLSYITGKIWKDSSNIWHYYKQDGTSELFTAQHSGDYRIIPSGQYS